MEIEAGGKNGIFPFDARTAELVDARTRARGYFRAHGVLIAGALPSGCCSRQQYRSDIGMNVAGG
jgi:hypothetical protein